MGNNGPAGSAPRAGRLIRYLPVVVIACLGVSLSLGVHVWGRTSEENHVRAAFREAANERVLTLERTIKIKVLALEAIRSFFHGSEVVERHEFKRFAGPIIGRLGGIQALEWAPRVPDAKRAEYEAAVRQQGLRDFAITERQVQGSMVRAARRAEYFPVHYVEPLKGNEAAAGFDLASEPDRLATITRSRDTGETVATGRITLVQNGDGQFGFLILLPVYAKETATDTVDERRLHLEGFVLGVFRIGELVETALSYLEPRSIDVLLTDAEAPQEKQFLHQHLSRTRKEQDGASEASPNGQEQTATLTVGGRRWLVRCTPAPGFGAKHVTWYPFGALCGGLALTALLCAYWTAGLSRTEYIKRLVAERTKELHNAQDRLTRHKQLAALGQLAGGVAHELRNPLAAIKNVGYWLHMTVKQPDPRMKEMLDILDREVITSEEIISGLLGFARPKMPMRKRVAINQIIPQALSRAVMPANVDVVTELNDSLPPIFGDSQQLVRALGNIILNAVQAMPKGGRLTITSSSPDPGWVAVSLSDTGEGIAKDDVGKLFEPLFTTKAKGIGLGLPVIRSIVEGHGGTIDVQSEVGQGSTFVVRLPVGGEE
jgi:signal transduction histidine kinase